MLPGGARLTFDPTPPLVPTDAGPGHVVQDRHGPLDLALLDQVDEGVQRLAVAPLTPRSKRIQELEAMVAEQSARHRATVVEAQEIIDRANGETRALQREKDRAGWRPQPPAPPGLSPCNARPVQIRWVQLEPTCFSCCSFFSSSLSSFSFYSSSWFWCRGNGRRRRRTEKGFNGDPVPLGQRLPAQPHRAEQGGPDGPRRERGGEEGHWPASAGQQES